MRLFNSFVFPLLLLTLVIVGCSEGPPSDTVATDSTPESLEATPVAFANTKCPIMGGKPTVELTAQYNDKTVGFCCDGCPQKWAALSSDEQAEKFSKVDANSIGDQDGAKVE